MKTTEPFKLELTHWQTHAEDIHRIRRLVFIEELNILTEQEPDDNDLNANYVIARDSDNNAIASARLLSNGTIDQLAVLNQWRGQKIATRLVYLLLEQAQSDGITTVNVKTISQALGFYEKLGFHINAEETAASSERSLSLSLAEWQQRRSGEVWDGPLNGIDDSVKATTALIKSVRRQLCIYTPYVQSKLYNDIDILAELRRRIVDQPHIHCRLLLPPASEWRRGCAHLAQLAERLSALELRMLPREEPRERSEFVYGFMLADDAGLLHYTDPRLCTGTSISHGASKARHLQGFFNEFWEKSIPDQELRSLGI